MSSNDKKIEIILRSEEVQGLLKALASHLKHSIAPDALRAFACDIGQAQKLQMTLKQQGGMAELKLKVKGLPTPEEAVAEQAARATAAPDSYKTIKKRLKTSFKFLAHSVEAQTLPGPELLQSFLDDSRAMCAHPDRGPGDYAGYAEILARFEAACKAEDRQAMALAYAELGLSKKTCHSLHK